MSKPDWRAALREHLERGDTMAEDAFGIAFDLTCVKIRELGEHAFTAKTGNSNADTMLRRARVFFRTYTEYGIHPA